MLKVADIINTEPVKIKIGSTIQEAAKIARVHLVSDLMVVDEEENFVGVLSEGDLIRYIFPDMKELIEATGGEFHRAFQIFIDNAKGSANETIDNIVLRNVITLQPSDELLKAATVMVTRHIRRLPVIQDKKLLGTVSCAEICFSIFSTN